MAAFTSTPQDNRVSKLDPFPREILTSSFDRPMQRKKLNNEDSVRPKLPHTETKALVSF